MSQAGYVWDWSTHEKRKRQHGTILSKVFYTMTEVNHSTIPGFSTIGYSAI